MLKRGAIALSAAMVVSLNGLVLPSSARAAGSAPDSAAPEDEIVIEARKTTPQSINPKATQTQDVITAKQLSQIPVTTDFIQALQYLPNVDVFEQGGNGLNGSTITVNGFDNTRLNFTLDGIPLSDTDSYSFYSNEFIQNSDIGQITITPSAGNATTLGLAAFGGSIDIQSRDPDATHGAVLQGGAGSFGTYSEYVKLNSGEYAQSLAPTRTYVSFAHATSQGYFDNSGTDYKNSLLLKSVTHVGPGDLTLFFTQNQQQFHYYGGCTAAQIAASGEECNRYTGPPVSTSYTAYQINRYQDSLAYLGYSFNIGGARIDNKAFFYYGNGFGGAATTAGSADPAQYRGPPAQVLPERSWNNTNRPGDILTITIPVANAMTLKTGALYLHSQQEHYEAKYDPVTLAEITAEPRIYDEPSLSKLVEPFVDVQVQPIDPLLIEAGVKYVIMDRDFTDSIHAQNDRSVSYRKALPSVGVNYEFVRGYHVYVNYSQNVRVPGYNQFYTGSVSGGILQNYNQDLDLEQANTIEAGFYVRSGNLEGRLSGFHTKYSNYILALQVQPPGQTGYVNEVVNAGDASYQGGTLALTYQITPWLSSFVNAGVLHSHLDRYNGPASNAPQQTEALGFEANTGGFAGSLAVHHKGPRYANYLDAFGNTNSFQYYGLPAITTLDASLGYKWDKPFGDSSFSSMEAKLILTNLTNEQKPTSAASNNFSLANPYLYLTEPFSVFATLTVSF